uniref:Dihydropteridine reductase n=1 Tax=Hirondellea gigas TaxID=1518452 RepID=A0A6A7GBS9_9CRUS
MASRVAQRILVYGGDGALGRAVIHRFRVAKWQTYCVDYRPNAFAHYNFTIEDRIAGQDWNPNSGAINDFLESQPKLDCVVNVAGGWTPGSISDAEIFQQCESMWKQNMTSSIAASSLAANYLRESGLLILTGAEAALGPTPDMIAYGLVKSAVHHMTKSLASPNGGLPKDSAVASLLPVMIDTPSNRKAAGESGPVDYSTWTPTADIANQIFSWTEKDRQPVNGGFYVFKTKNHKTTIHLHD